MRPPLQHHVSSGAEQSEHIQLLNEKASRAYLDGNMKDMFRCLVLLVTNIQPRIKKEERTDLFRLEHEAGMAVKNAQSHQKNYERVHGPFSPKDVPGSGEAWKQLHDLHRLIQVHAQNIKW